MKNLIKKVLKEQVTDKVITKVLSQLERGLIKPPYFNNLDLIGLTEDEIKVALEKFTNGEVNGRVIYNKRNKQIYYEDSDGYWEKREYDERGNKIYFEDSYGYWVKQEYNERGNRIYFEDSYGNIEDKR